MSGLPDLGLKPIALGRRVVYTHRCSGVHSGTMRDVPATSRRKYSRHLCGRDGYHLPAPSRLDGYRGARKPRRLDVWTCVWPERGHGVVVGLTHRTEGWIDSYDFEDAPCFSARDRFPVYEVKTKLNGPRLLIPAWACVPYPPEPWRIEWRDGTPESGPANIYLGSSVQSWESWVARAVSRPTVTVAV